MGDVVRLDVERWAEAFMEDGLAVHVSSRGRVRFFTADHDGGATISMEQMMRLGKALAEAYGQEEESGGDNAG